MQYKRIAIVFNPKAGTARLQELNALRDALYSEGTEVILLPTTAQRYSAETLAKQARFDLEADLVIAFGGDGTVREVTQGLEWSGIPMGVYPGGTGNLFARTFYSQPTPERFAEFLRNGHPQPIDVIHYDCTDVAGKRHNGIVLVSIGFGCLSEAISCCDPTWKRRFGRLVYAYNIGKACLRPKLVNAEFHTAMGVRRESLAAAFLLNVVPNLTPFLSRGCNPSDGLMDVVMLRAKNFGQCLSSTVRLATGAPERSPHYARCRLAEVTVRTDRPIVLDTDGDVGPTTQEVHLCMHAGAARMILA